ncbi:MAG: hypothetical protein JSU72_16825 [Deltaproteobacteria bacterium]|nr:MAG: hypothetical protein JSU72_16825 [Deltaproteobacteria bacterium]
MKRCMITITTLLQDKSNPTVVLDISRRGVSVNCPKGSGFQVESVGSKAKVQLRCKIPGSSEELHFEFNDLNLTGAPKAVEYDLCA